MFKDKNIEITVTEYEETEYLPGNDANKKRLLEAIDNVNSRKNLIEADINKLYGICAGLPGGSEEFMREKHEEIELEEKRFNDEDKAEHNNISSRFNAVKIKTKGIKFNREEANER